MKIEVNKCETRYWVRDNKATTDIIVNEEEPNYIRVTNNQDIWRTWEEKIKYYEQIIKAIKELKQQRDEANTANRK